MTTVFLDESGYSGSDLFNPDQPVFAIATHILPEVESVALAKEFFGHAKTQELKHATLQRRPRHREAVVAFLSHTLRQPEHFRVAFAHKRFALTLKLVDLIVEPVANNHGFDIYRSGFFRSLGNLIFFALQTEGSGTLNEVLRAFQDLVCLRTPATFSAFLRVVRQRAVLDCIEDVLYTVRVHANQTCLTDITALPDVVLDLSFTLALQCICSWRSAGVGRMVVLHDRSSNMARQRWLWDAVVSPSAPESRVGYGSFGVEFPLGVEETTFVDSKTHVGIQLADIIAGALAVWGGWIVRGKPQGETYGAHLDEAFQGASGNVVASVIWPVPDVKPERTSSELGNFLDYLIDRAQQASAPPRARKGTS